MDLNNKDFKVVNFIFDITYTIVRIENNYYVTRKGHKARSYWDLQAIKNALRNKEWELVNKIMWI